MLSLTELLSIELFDRVTKLSMFCTLIFCRYLLNTSVDHFIKKNSLGDWRNSLVRLDRFNIWVCEQTGFSTFSYQAFINCIDSNNLQVLKHLLNWFYLKFYVELILQILELAATIFSFFRLVLMQGVRYFSLSRLITLIHFLSFAHERTVNCSWDEFVGRSKM